MYDERIGQLDHHWVTYAYAREEGIELGRAEGIKYGMQRGRAEGRKVRSNDKITRKVIADGDGVSVKTIARAIKEIYNFKYVDTGCNGRGNLMSKTRLKYTEFLKEVS